jgi:hypothetical protein
MLQQNTSAARGIWAGINPRNPRENILAKDVRTNLV